MDKSKSKKPKSFGSNDRMRKKIEKKNILASKCVLN